MTEGPDSRFALLTYPLETLFHNANAVFLHNAETIKMINEILITSVNEYVQHKKNDFALETSNWDEKLQRDYKDMYKILFNKKPGRIFDETDERLSDIAYELFDTFRISDSFPKFIREMSLVYLISKFEAFLAKNLEILFTRKPDTMIRKDKKASFELYLNLRIWTRF
jgi:hypothetical protein